MSLQLQIAEIERVTREQDAKLRAEGEPASREGVFGKCLVNLNQANPSHSAMLDEIDRYLPKEK